MNQPDLGLKITELRQQKAFTQEKLAEYCDVSTRTIQRIESGEVEPRSFTRNSLSNILEFDLGKESTSNENLWLALLHLSSVVCIVFIPLLLWSWKKDQSYKIDQQGRACIELSDHDHACPVRVRADADRRSFCLADGSEFGRRGWVTG